LISVSVQVDQTIPPIVLSAGHSHRFRRDNAIKLVNGLSGKAVIDMPEKTAPRKNKSLPSTAQPRGYRIKLRGHFDRAWVAAFDPISFTSSGEHTLIEILADQAALRAILNRLWDLNLDVLAMEMVSPGLQGGGE
jgi:hypothetical protein